MNLDCVAGPDGYTTYFVQKVWDIIKNGIVIIVLEFFARTSLPKFFSYTMKVC